MGCGQSKQPVDIRTANLRAVEQNLRRGKDRMGHDPYDTERGFINSSEWISPPQIGFAVAVVFAL